MSRRPAKTSIAPSAALTRIAFAIAIVIVIAARPAAADDPPAPAEPASEAAESTPDDRAPKATKRRGKTKFYDFDELLVGGELRSPDAYFTTARERMRWDRLLRLRRSFLGALLATSRHPALRGGP